MKKLLFITLAILVSASMVISAQAATYSSIEKFGFTNAGRQPFDNFKDGNGKLLFESGDLVLDLNGDYEFSGIGYNANFQNSFNDGNSIIFSDYLPPSSNVNDSNITWSSPHTWADTDFKSNHGWNSSADEAKLKIYRLNEEWNGFQKDTFIIGFEDKKQNTGYMDHTDLMFAARTATQTPAPTTLLLFGSGILGLVAIRRKQQNK